ncbi:hypothetical protein ES703_50684 [subsurface metagenome]
MIFIGILRGDLNPTVTLTELLENIGVPSVNGSSENPSSATNPLSFSFTSSISAWLGITAAWMSQSWAENAAINGPMMRAIPSSLRPQPKALSPTQIPLYIIPY